MKKLLCMTLIATVSVIAFSAFAGEVPTPPLIRITEYNRFSVARVLEENIGNQIEVTISTGATFRGKLIGVGAQAIHLGGLANREFYDAAVDKAAIVAVVVKVRDR